jgi:general secretion pathway protein D
VAAPRSCRIERDFVAARELQRPAQMPSPHPDVRWLSSLLFALLLLVLAARVEAKESAPPTHSAGESPAEPAKPAAETAPPGKKTGAALELERIPDGAAVTLNLENATLDELVRLISSVTGKRFILHGAARDVKASIYAPEKVSAREAYQAFLSILELHGLALVEAGAYAKIVESKDIQRRPIRWRSEPGAPPANDAFMTQLYHVQHAEPASLAALLEQFKSVDGSIQTYEPTRMLIVTDTGYNLRRMLELVQTVDVPRASGRVWIEPLEHADAEELAGRITDILDASRGEPSKSAAAPTRGMRSRTPKGESPAAPAEPGERLAPEESPKIFAEPRTNALVVVGSEHTYLRVLELVRALDVPLPGDGGIHVHALEYAKAEDLAKTLGTLVSDSRAAPAAKGGAPAETALSFEGKISITADVTANSLVVTSSLRDYQTLKRVIAELDKPRRQVFIEAVILDLDASKDRNFGLSMHSGASGVAGAGSVGAVASNGIGGLAPLMNAESLSGLALGLSGRNISVAGMNVPSFGVALHALASESQSSVLSTPHLIAMENEQAEINIGSNEPLQGSAVPGALPLAASALGTSQQLATALGGSTVERRDVGIRIRITPHINTRGEIHLEIEQESSSLGALAPGNLSARSINTRTAKTSVLVKDRETVVIGGMVQEKMVTSREGIPVLGDIPLLGRLFTRTTTEKKRGNLLLFLTPYLLDSQDDLRAIYERKLEEREMFLEQKALFDGRLPRVASYERGTGLVGELLKAGAQRASEARTEEPGEPTAPPFDHSPKPAVTGSLEHAQVAAPRTPES